MINYPCFADCRTQCATTDNHWACHIDNQHIPIGTQRHPDCTCPPDLPPREYSTDCKHHVDREQWIRDHITGPR